MTSRTLFLLVILAAVSVVYARSSDKDAFPDYNRLEYAKPLPPVDQQVEESKPGSIQRRFGEKSAQASDREVPLNALPIPLRGAAYSDDSEPPISDLLEQADAVIKSTTPPPGTPSAVAPSPEAEKLQ
jgi:hypothetical protein